MPKDRSGITTGPERRSLFLRYLNRGWLAFGILTLISLPIFPEQRNQFIYLVIVTIPAYPIILFLNWSGKTRLAGAVFTLIVNFGFYGLFLVLVQELGAEEAFRTQITAWMLMGLAVLFAGGLVDKWAAPGLALVNSLLLIGTRLVLAPAAEPRPSSLVFWWMMAITIWLYERTLQRALAQSWNELAERKRAENTLRKSEEHYRLIAQNAEDIIWTMDMQLKLTYVSPAAGRILGYSADEILASTPEQFLTPESFAVGLKVFREEVAAAQPQPDPNYARVLELEYRRKNGSTFWVEMKFSFFRDLTGQAISVLGVGRDITARKQADEKIRQLSRAVEQSPASLVITNTTGEIEYVNPKFTQVTGYSSEEALGQNPRILKSGHTPPDEYKQLWETITSGREWQGEFQNRKKNGDLYWEFAVISPISNDRKEITHFIAIKEDITARKQAEEQIQRQVEYLRALRMIDITITAGTDLHLSLQFILRHALTHLRVTAADILLLNPITHRLEYAAGLGFRTQAIEHASLHIGEDYAGQVVMERKAIFVHGPKQAAEAHKRILAGEQFVFYCGVPLIAKGATTGVLELYHRAEFDLDRELIEFLEALAGQAALAIDNITLFQNLQRSNLELSLAYETTLEGWSNAMDLRDKETEGHTQRVTELTLKLARQMGIPQAGLTHIRRGGLLHDIGKLGVPDNILLKAEDLTEAEWQIMRKHPTYAYEMLSPITYLEASLDIPYCHHEKWDGSGYPRGLKGEQIPLPARIFAIADVWDAITSDRPYRHAWTKEQALDYIKEQSGKHFDSHVVEEFLKLITWHPTQM